MTVIVKNFGAMAQEKDTRSPAATFGDQGTVRVNYQNVAYVFGPNESKSFSDNGIAAAVIAQDARLRQVTQADGVAAKANASVSYGIY